MVGGVFREATFVNLNETSSDSAQRHNIFLEQWTSLFILWALIHLFKLIALGMQKTKYLPNFKYPGRNIGWSKMMDIKMNIQKNYTKNRLWKYNDWKKMKSYLPKTFHHASSQHFFNSRPYTRPDPTWNQSPWFHWNPHMKISHRVLSTRNPFLSFVTSTHPEH